MVTGRPERFVAGQTVIAAKKAAAPGQCVVQT